ncbi:hypothetical protein BV372_08910 [Nostoc sp. T09]|uniref:hypothetical protein n=1 Tax=Nostoc sp. T09 TaxID=1932621 RepID=UPI000A3BD7F5|nr:hypothetical protein [Nostoc sp. T09]OUL36009.1 hypothetical protein BV372_08910 [Nostoc sp. T09]
MLIADAQFNQPKPDNQIDQLSNTNSDFSAKIKRAEIIHVSQLDNFYKSYLTNLLKVEITPKKWE